MNYGEKVLSRVTDPGFLIFAAGAVLVYTSSIITRGIKDDDRRNKANVAVKAAGCAVSLLGMILLFT